MEPTKGELSEEERQEVLNIIAMHGIIKNSFDALEDKTGIDETQVRFRGFDAREEPALYAHAQRLLGEKHPDLDSHHIMLNMYREMLNIWNEYEDEFHLSKSQIQTLLRPVWRYFL